MKYYEHMIDTLNEKGCKMLSSEEEAEQNKSKRCYKIKYIASCGHEHQVFFNVFKSRGTGIICSKCKTVEQKNAKKQQIVNKEISPIQNTISEFKFICKLQNIVKDKFIMKKAFDGCLVDLIYKPNNILEDKWVGIQVKTNNRIHLTYGFFINNNYTNCLLMLYCHQDESLWIIPENIIERQQKISIGCKRSKYNVYKVEKENILTKLEELYENTTKYEFEKLDTPASIYQQREKEFRKFRESRIDYLDFVYEGMEATSYDFQINGLKIQEKVISTRNDKKTLYLFNIVKNNVNKNIANKSHCQYSAGDNDFYWINCNNKQIFFVIPEKILIMKGYVGNPEGPISFSLNPYNLSETSMWIKPYIFDYETIEEEDNKTRLLELLNI